MADQKSHTTLLDDLPAGKDALDFQPYIDTLADIIASPNTRTPLTIGVFGTWGSGKTSLMRLVQKGLPGSFRTAWFDAWKFEKEATLWRALLLSVLTALREAIPKNDETSHQELDDLETSLYQTVEREEVGNLQINWGKLAEGVGQGAIQIGLSFLPGVNTLTKMVEELQKEGAATATAKLVEALQRERSKIHIKQVQFLDEFQKQFRELTQKHIVDKKLRLVVFIDDLDRCLPEKAVEVLEAIKLFLDVEGCVFVLGLDQEVIARGIEIKYKELGFDHKIEEESQLFAINGTRYLEKIIQLPFQIPPIERAQMRKFISELVKVWPHEECPRVFTEGLGDNPRQIKRTINSFLLLWRLAERRQLNIDPVRLAKIVAIQNVHPELYNFLKGDQHRYLWELEDYSYRIIQTEDETLSQEDGVSPVEPSAALSKFLKQRGIASVFRVLALHSKQSNYNFRTLSPEKIRVYFTLTQRVETPRTDQTSQTASSNILEPQMVYIPAGSFLMGAKDDDNDAIPDEKPQHEVELSEYWIGKYPVTNSEYQVFVRNQKHTPPSYCNGEDFPQGQGDHPVVWISWDDARKYCESLKSKTKKNYRLPTEAEWEKAARGTDGRLYPWGNGWDQNKCNSKENGITTTTPVGQYSPSGDSPYSCADMAGNVWEWCVDWYSEIEYQNRKSTKVKDPQGTKNGEFHVVRGGSYDFAQSRIRCVAREKLTSRGGNYNDGFRVAMSPSSISDGNGFETEGIR